MVVTKYLDWVFKVIFNCLYTVKTQDSFENGRGVGFDND